LPTIKLEGNYPVGSRVEYQCSSTENDNNNGSKLQTCQFSDGAAWNISVLCGENGEWSQLSEPIFRPNISNLIRNIPTSTTPLLVTSQQATITPA